jgi:hypothetical protein
VKGDTTARPDPRPALLLAGGFTVSAVALYAAVWALGAGLLGPWRGTAPMWAGAAVAIALLLAADLGLFGWRTPTWRRQTPKWFLYRYGERISALLWGLDAGLVFTTIRVTSVSWAALLLTFTGVLPWWSGAVYAAGFVLPELAFNLWVPRRPAPGSADPEPTWVVETLFRARPRLRPTGLAALTAAAGVAVLAAVLSG